MRMKGWGNAKQAGKGIERAYGGPPLSEVDSLGTR